ncbi:MAG: hypothetical protein NXI00_23175, partial [Cytophagales bacterium]|nr:hypothetical protein [Cytophagales bacterium]
FLELNSTLVHSSERNNKRRAKKSKFHLNLTHCSELNHTSSPVLPYERRKSSVTDELVRRFDYNDPELELKVSHHGIVVMGGTKEKLMDLLTDLGFMEIQYITEFLGVYPYFAAPLELLYNLMGCYLEPSIPSFLDTKNHQQFIQRTKKR